MGIELSWDELDHKTKYLRKLQKINLPKIKKVFSNLGYKVIKVSDISDGWGDGFKINEFTVKDKRSCVRDKDKLYLFTGNDNNSAIMKVEESGGRSGFADVKGAKTLKDIGYKRGVDY
jgi:hypothetical protein